jgi:hypothetical protein
MNKANVAKIGARRALPDQLDLPFVLALFLPLLLAAVIVNAPPLHALGWPRYVLNCLIWLATLITVLHDEQWRGRLFAFAKTRNERTIRAALAGVALLALCSYYDFGRFHGGGRFVHYHDVYHYYMGSKYFPEVGYEGLYAATHRALVENDPALADAIGLVKNLRTYDVENARISMQRSDGVSCLFSDQRWEQFKRDVRFFQAEIAPAEWQILLVDHGFNATPFWTSVGSVLSAHLPLNHGTLLFLALLDPALLAAALVLVWRTFDAQTCLLTAIFLFANFFGVFDITGGAFLRQLWLAALIGCVCFYRQGRMVPAALLLSVAVLDRIFPVVFLLPALVLLVGNILRRRPVRETQVRFLAVFACSAAVLVWLSSGLTRGPQTWFDWYGKVSAHNRWFYTNQLSLRNLFTVNPAQSLKTISSGWDEGLWLRERETLDARTRNTLLATRAALLALLMAAFVRRQDLLGSLALVSFAPLVLFYPADYYCVFLVIAILCWRGNRAMAIAMMALQALFWLVNTVLSSGLRIELLHWIISLCLMLAFVIFLARELFHRPPSAPRSWNRLPGLLLGGAAAIVLAAAVADAHAARQDRARVQLDLTPQDVSLARALTPRLEQMTAWGNGWSRDDHLLCVVEKPAAEAVIRVPTTRAGLYRVTVAYSVGPPFGIVALAINGQPPYPASNLYSPHLGLQSMVYENVALRAGQNEFNFSVTGKDPAAKDFHFAVDTITLDYITSEPTASAPAASHAAALAQALAWLNAHPADPFDGGRPAICNEIAVLYCLASIPELSASRPACLTALGERMDRISTGCGPRIRPEDNGALLVAAYVSHQLESKHPALDQAVGGLKPWTDALYADKSAVHPLLAGAYFNRLNPTQSVPCDPEQSILYLEYAERKLSQILAGEVDRTKSPAVTTTVLGLSQDICALTDFGQQPPPSSGFLADQPFWAQLCEHGIRWSMHTGDLLTLARLVHMAQCLRVAPAVPALPAALDFLIEHQQPGGSFGVVTSDSPNPIRDGVLSALLAIASSLH